MSHEYCKAYLRQAKQQAAAARVVVPALFAWDEASRVPGGWHQVTGPGGKVIWSGDACCRWFARGAAIYAMIDATVKVSKMWKVLSEQLVLPQVQRGVDYGIRRPVLAQKGNHVLLVQPGHTYTAGIGCREYSPTVYELRTADGTGLSWSAANELFSGRFSRAKLLAAAPRIAAWLGCKVEELPDIRRNLTYVWDEP